MKEINFRGVSDRDVARSVALYQRAFRARTEHMGRSSAKGTDLYNLQVELCYLIHELQTTFKHDRPRVLALLNDFFESLPAPPTETA